MLERNGACFKLKKMVYFFFSLSLYHLKWCFKFERNSAWFKGQTLSACFEGHMLGSNKMHRLTENSACVQRPCFYSQMLQVLLSKKYITLKEHYIFNWRSEIKWIMCVSMHTCFFGRNCTALSLSCDKQLYKCIYIYVYICVCVRTFFCRHYRLKRWVLGGNIHTYIDTHLYVYIYIHMCAHMCFYK